MSNFVDPDDWEETLSLMEKAKARSRFTLTYVMGPRELHQEGISGPPMPCAYEGVVQEDGEVHQAHEGDGDWSCEYDDTPTTEEQWHNFWLRAAIGEAVHEALEHFHVDGKPFFDPHADRTELEIFRLCDKLSDDILRLRTI